MASEQGVLDWAFAQRTGRPSANHLLRYIGKKAWFTRLCFMSITAMAEGTEHDRKTVIIDLQCLEQGGWLRRTGERKGRTKQIVVYELMVGTEPTPEQLQFRNSSAKPGKSPVHGSGNLNYLAKRDCETVEKLCAVPNDLLAAGLSSELWKQYVQMRASIGKRLIAYSERLLLAKLKAIAEEGHDIPKLVRRAIVNCWTDFRSPGSRKKQKDGAGDAAVGGAVATHSPADRGPNDACSVGTILRQGKLGPRIF